MYIFSTIRRKTDAKGHSRYIRCLLPSHLGDSIYKTNGLSRVRTQADLAPAA